MENKDKNKATAAKKKGIVVSDKMDKTIVVEINTLKTHKKYRKKYNSTKKYKVHDETNKYKEGDEVEFISSKPMSSGKRFIAA